ncbi:LysE family translocator [Pontimicrobium sp. SW4]|uniref:LysE family translocator n=1 Tax=Pontimicrobium sp. SW4 TaxID=3153519 RepID=A0AAU7BU47_9FLAO
MSFTIWISFLIVAAVAAVSPGPGTMLTVSNAVRFGARNAFLTALGNAIGLLFVSTFVMLGLGVVLRTSATLFFMFKLIGALYLIYLGIKHLNNKQSGFIKSSEPSKLSSPNSAKLFGQGLLIAVTNPKAIVFFFGIFPHFITNNQALFPQFIILTLTFSICVIVSHLLYIVLLSRIRTWFSDYKRTRWFNRVVGSIFIFLGLGVFWLKRT